MWLLLLCHRIWNIRFCFNQLCKYSNYVTKWICHLFWIHAVLWRPPTLTLESMTSRATAMSGLTSKCCSWAGNKRKALWVLGVVPSVFIYGPSTVHVLALHLHVGPYRYWTSCMLKSSKRGENTVYIFCILAYNVHDLSFFLFNSIHVPRMILASKILSQSANEK